MPSALLTGFRNIASAVSGIWSGRSIYPAVSAETERTRPEHPDMARDFADLLPQARFRQAVSDCRWLAIASDIVGGALRQKTDYVSASHFATHFAGVDRAWGEQAEEKCRQLDAFCCTRGERFDWKRLWGLTIPHRATDGGVFFNLTESDTGWPLVQPIEATRIGTREDQVNHQHPEIVAPKSARAYRRAEDGRLQKIYTPYAGLRILSGIIYDDSGREVAYRVLGDATDGSDDVDVSAQDMVYIARPAWYSEGRPLPEMAVSVLALQDIHLARQAQLTKHIDSARRIAFEETADGLAPAARRLQDPLATRTPNGTVTKFVEEGQWSFVKSGHKVTPWDSKTPGGEWMAYDDKIVASALHGIRWRIEMLDPSGLKGANTRGFADQINTLIMEDFDFLVPPILRVRRWQIAKLIQRGDLAPSNDWWRWGVTPPPEFSPDPGRAINSELEAVRSGAQSMPHLHRRWGQRPADVLNEQADYLLLRRQVAQAKGLTPEESAQLGTLSQPGEAGPGSPTSDENGKALASIEQTKARADAFGVSVRAGAVTPSEEDEQFMREKLGLPPMSAAVKSAWAKEGVRRRITIAGADGSRPAAGGVPSEP